jgi:uncharacterized protein (DUF488 family)
LGKKGRQTALETEPSGATGVRIFSIGYEGKSIEGFIDMLKRNGVERLIDVRKDPYSRKPFFSKKALAAKLQEAGVEYVGVPELGTDKATRDKYKMDSDVGEFLKVYKAGFEKNIEFYERLKELAIEKSSCIMCYEEDYRQCHRQVIEERMETDGFRVIHLGGDQQIRIDD